MNATDLFGLIGSEASDEQKWALIRTYRNQLLVGCDWTQLPDAPLTLDEKQAWSAYRQTLRDLPEDFRSPDEVVLPDVPGSAA